MVRGTLIGAVQLWGGWQKCGGIGCGGVGVAVVVWWCGCGGGGVGVVAWWCGCGKSGLEWSVMHCCVVRGL